MVTPDTYMFVVEENFCYVFIYKALKILIIVTMSLQIKFMLSEKGLTN